MMHLDTYYRFERLPDSAKTRRDLVAFAHEYPPLHRSNQAGDVWIYITSARAYIDAKERLQAEKAISTREGSLSSVYHPDVSYPLFGMGDVKGTEDALLFRFSDSEQSAVDVFVAKGKKNLKGHLFQMLCEGELDEEIRQLKDAASGSSESQRLAA
jgi:hypothetical protein